MSQPYLNLMMIIFFPFLILLLIVLLILLKRKKQRAKSKSLSPRTLPKGPKTTFQKEWARGMRLNRKFIDINVARELALKKQKQQQLLSVLDPEKITLKRKAERLETSVRKKDDIIKELMCLNQNHQTIAEVTYCIFDIETTGFDKKFDDIIEIACHKYHNYKLIDQFHCLIYTPILLSPRIRQLTKLTNQKLNQAGIPITTALKQFVAFIKNTVLVAHNGINFDLPFINNKLVANGLLPINNCLVDTMKLSKTLFSQERNHNLKALCNHLGLYYDENQAHQANQDVIYTSAAFFKLLQQFPDLQLPNINRER